MGSLEFVPDGAIVTATVRPAKLLARPELAALARLIQEQDGWKKEFGISVERMERLTIIVVPGEPDKSRPGPRFSAVIVKGVTRDDIATMVKTVLPETAEREHLGRKYLRSTREAATNSCLLADEVTAVFAEFESDMWRMIAAGPNGPTEAKWAGWKDVSSDDAAAIVDLKSLRPTLDQLMQQMGGAVGPFGAFAPIWENSSTMTAGFKFARRPSLQGRLASESVADAKKVKDTLTALVTVLRNSLATARKSAAENPQLQGFAAIAEIADAVLETVEVTQKEREVEFSAFLPAAQAVALTGLLTTEVTAARAAARASQTKNNLKQIALAMHNYHELHNGFPPAVLFGPDGKTPYSWRVELLPQLDEMELYRQYDFNQPWDSEVNKKVLAKMPAIYRDPNDPPTTTVASYFVLTGPDGAFSDKEGPKIRQFIDGPSNTILAVEAKRDIPWTKPEDIPYAADKPLPKLGGHYPEGFLAMFCDGAVRMIRNVDEALLRSAFTKGGGEVLDLDALLRQPD